MEEVGVTPLIKHVFLEDVLDCPCGGRRRVLSMVFDSESMSRVLRHLGLPWQRPIRLHLVRVAPGEVEIELPFRAYLCQQHGFLHAGVISTIADSACGYAALSLLAEATDVLAIEFKINSLAPAKGDLVARGKVLRSGRRISACTCEVFAKPSEGEELVAMMQGSMIAKNLGSS